MKTNGELQRLVALSRDLVVALPRPVVAQVADLALRLHADVAERKGAILTDAQRRTYRERGEVERDGMCAAVEHILLALVLLDIIELPAGAPG